MMGFMVLNVIMKALKVNGVSLGISVKSLAKVKNTVGFKMEAMHQLKSKDPLHPQSKHGGVFFLLGFVFVIEVLFCRIQSTSH